MQKLVIIAISLLLSVLLLNNGDLSVNYLKYAYDILRMLHPVLDVRNVVILVHIQSRDEGETADEEVVLLGHG